MWICANADPPWFLNADPPDFSAKEGERLSFFASIRNKWWDGPVRCAIPKICNGSCKFANITAFYTSLRPCQEEAQHRKRQIFDGFCDIWQILRTSRDFSSRAFCCLMITVSVPSRLRLLCLHPDWLLILWIFLDFFLTFLDFWIEPTIRLMITDTVGVPFRLRSFAPWLTFNFPQIQRQVYCVFFFQWAHIFFCALHHWMLIFLLSKVWMFLSFYDVAPWLTFNFPQIHLVFSNSSPFVFSLFTDLMFSFVFCIIGRWFIQSQNFKCFCCFTMPCLFDSSNVMSILSPQQCRRTPTLKAIKLREVWFHHL